MAHYFLYRLNADGHLTLPGEDIHAENDAAAIHQAKRRLDGYDVEVWQGPRYVITLFGKNASK
jgi:hypothetical protein